MPRGVRAIRRLGPPCPECGAISQEITDWSDPDDAGRVYMCHTPEGDCSVEIFDQNDRVLKHKA
jgi:hypothetical protein